MDMEPAESEQECEIIDVSHSQDDTDTSEDDIYLVNSPIPTGQKVST